MIHFTTIPLTGTSVNPARSIGAGAVRRRRRDHPALALHPGAAARRRRWPASLPRAVRPRTASPSPARACASAVDAARRGPRLRRARRLPAAVEPAAGPGQAALRPRPQPPQQWQQPQYPTAPPPASSRLAAPAAAARPRQPARSAAHRQPGEQHLGRPTTGRPTRRPRPGAPQPARGAGRARTRSEPPATGLLDQADALGVGARRHGSPRRGCPRVSTTSRPPNVPAGTVRSSSTAASTNGPWPPGRAPARSRRRPGGGKHRQPGSAPSSSALQERVRSPRRPGRGSLAEEPDVSAGVLGVVGVALEDDLALAVGAEVMHHHAGDAGDRPPVIVLDAHLEPLDHVVGDLVGPHRPGARGSHGLSTSAARSRPGLDRASGCPARRRPRGRSSRGCASPAAPQPDISEARATRATVPSHGARMPHRMVAASVARRTR